MELSNSYQNKVQEQKVHETQREQGKSVYIKRDKEGLQHQWQT